MAEDFPFKKALVGFLVVDALFVIAAVVVYVGVIQPRIQGLETARDARERENLAMLARVHAVEGRLAVANGDSLGARRAAGDVLASLDALDRLTQKGTGDAHEVTQLRNRAQQVADELTANPQAARADFEELDARLAAYPANR